MCSIDVLRTISSRGPLGSKACHTLGQDFDLRTKSQQFEILSFKIKMWTKWPPHNVLVFFCSFFDWRVLNSFPVFRFTSQINSYLNVYRRRTWLITNCTRCIYQEFFLERYTIVRNRFTYLALERHAVWILATEPQKPVFPDALVRPHLSHIGQIVVPLLSLKSLCYQSNHFVWIVLSPKSFFWFYHYHQLFLRVVSSTCKYFPSLSYPKSDILTVSAWTCESKVGLHFWRKGSSFCLQIELVLVRLALYLMSIKYYQLGRNLLWPQPIKIAKHNNLSRTEDTGERTFVIHKGKPFTFPFTLVKTDSSFLFYQRW